MDDRDIPEDDLTRDNRGASPMLVEGDGEAATAVQEQTPSEEKAEDMAVEPKEFSDPECEGTVIEKDELMSAEVDAPAHTGHSEPPAHKQPTENTSGEEVIQPIEEEVNAVEENKPMATQAPAGPKAEEQKDLFAETVRRYFEQYTQGCGNAFCSNTEYCYNASGTKRAPNDAAILAVEMAQKPNRHFCAPRTGSVPTAIDVSSLQTQLSECEATGSFSPLIRALGTQLYDPENIAVSFASNQVVSVPTDDNMYIDDSQIKSFYDIASHCNLTDPFMSTLERLLTMCEVNAPRQSSPMYSRLYAILLENPLLVDPDHHMLMGRWSIAVSSLPERNRKLLTSWFKTFDKDKLQTTIGLLQQCITVRIYLTRGIDDGVTAAVKVLAMINEANNVNKLVPFQEFYNDAVNNECDFRDDFSCWLKKKQGQPVFSFCSYPFILDPGSKSQILQIDSVVQMRQSMEDALWQSIANPGMVSMPFLVVKVRRDSVINDALHQIRCRDPEDLKKPLKVKFVGEEGVDEGGVQKEFFQLIMRDLFDPKYGMFTYDEDTGYYWFNPSSFDSDEFELVGMLLGISIYNSVILGLHFPMVVYNKLMGVPTGMVDLEVANPMLANGLKQLLDFDGDVEEVFARTFQVSYEAFGEVQTYDLIENGGDKPVTNENRKEYVDLYLKWYFDISVENQFTPFDRGFKLACGGDALQLFRPEELEQLICGNEDLDFEALEEVCHYEDGFESNSVVIRWFWELVHSFDEKQKKKLLFFTTGTDRAPIKGLGSLTFVISKNGPDSDRLPTAHTCFNHLLLPEYSSKDKLKERLQVAINNAEGFGLM